MVTGDRNAVVHVCEKKGIALVQKDREVVTKEKKKVYRFVFDKRVITQGYETKPYGY